MLPPIRLTLEYEADQAYRKVINGNLIWNTYLKIRHKMDKMMTLMLSHYIKRESDKYILSQRRLNSKPIPPFIMTKYSWTYWRDQGGSTFKAIIARCEKALNTSCEIAPQDYDYLLLNQIFERLSYKPRKEPRKDSRIIFFDSYRFFNGGHLANIEETLDIIDSQLTNIYCYFFLDRRMILFPTLAEKIIDRFDFCEIVDCTDNTICFCEQELREIKGSRFLDELIRIDFKGNENYRSANENCFNPTFHWADGNAQITHRVSQTAWQLSYSEAESKETVLKHLFDIGISRRNEDYIVVHSRNSNFLADGIRNSPPLKERKELFEGIKNAGFNVLVIGVNKPEEKYRSENVTYIDEIGTFDDAFQIHVLNGATALVGGASGMSQMTYCTNTPSLFFDFPFPTTSNLPRDKYLALLKPIYMEGIQQGFSEYYNIKMVAYDCIQSSSTRGEGSPLNLLNYKLAPCDDKQILHGFYELLEKANLSHKISSDDNEYKKYKLSMSYSEKAESDRRLINQSWMKFQNTGNKEAFSLETLAGSNWQGF